MRIAICLDNLVDVSTLTASSSASGFPVSNLQHRWLSRKWRSLSATEAHITIDCGTQKQVNNVSFIACNFSELGTITITLRGSNNGNWGQSQIIFSNTMAFLFRNFNISFTPANFRYYRVVVSASTAKVFEIGRLYLCQYKQLTAQVSKDFSERFSDQSIINFSDSYHLSGIRKEIVRKVAYRFPYMGASDLQILLECYKDKGIIGDFVIIERFQKSIGERENIYCRFTGDFDFSNVTGEKYFSMAFEVEELK